MKFDVGNEWVTHSFQEKTTFNILTGFQMNLTFSFSYLGIIINYETTSNRITIYARTETVLTSNLQVLFALNLTSKPTGLIGIVEASAKLKIGSIE